MPGPTATTPVAWYRADAGTSTVVDGAAVTQWDDQSGNGRHLTGVASYKTNEVAGMPVVRFDGVDDQLGYQNATEFITGTGLTLGIVYKIRASATNTAVVGLTNNEVGADWSSVTGMRLSQEVSLPTEIVTWRNSVALTRQTTPADGTLMLHLVWSDGTNMNHRYNLIPADGDSQSPSSDAWSIGWIDVGAGWHAGAPSGFGAFDVLELALYDVDLGAERDDLETYLNTRRAGPEQTAIWPYNRQGPF